MNPTCSLRPLIPLIPALLLAACTPHPGGIELASPVAEGELSDDIAEMTRCNAEKNYISCPQDGQAVCGIKQLSGPLRHNATLLRETYPNACTACSDETVIGYIPDAC
ncbi:MAG TPA: hypothetical protein PLB10_10435 [Thiolinea sp.]|nr:hypothetical protein [Thiolinea sp.]